MSDMRVLPELEPGDPFRLPRVVGTPLPLELERQLEALANIVPVLESLIGLLEGLLAEAEAARRDGRFREGIALYNRLLEEARKARDRAGLGEQVRLGLQALEDPGRLTSYAKTVEPDVWRALLAPPPRRLQEELLASFEPLFRAREASPEIGVSPGGADELTIRDVPADQTVSIGRLVEELSGLPLPSRRRAAFLAPDARERRRRAREQLISLLLRLPVVTTIGLAECHLGLGLLAETQELLDLAVRPEAWEGAGFLEPYRYEILGLFIRLRLAWADSFLAYGDVVNAEPELLALLVPSADGRFAMPPEAWPRTRPVLAPTLPELEAVLTALNNWLADPQRGVTLITAEGAPRFRLGTPAIRALVDVMGRELDIARGRAQHQNGFRVAPVWRFEYLFQLASYFTTQARSAEMRAIEFARHAETASLTRQQLQDALQLAQIDEDLADIRVEEAGASLTVAQRNLELAHTRRGNARQRLQGYSAISHEVAVYQALSASLGAGSDGVWDDIQPHVDRMRRKGRTRGERGLLIGANTYIVATMSADFERANLEAQVDEANDAIGVADAQSSLERTRERFAQATRLGARLRRETAQRYLESFKASVFSPELLREMSRLMQEISDGYFNAAFDTALLMQQAFDYEYRTRLRVIDPGNRPRGVEGRLAADLLAQLIDSFKGRELELGDRRQSVVQWELPLHALFPTLWREFQRRGVLEFALSPDLLDRAFPGLYDVALLEVRIAFRGVTQDYLRWSLTNSHLGAIRLLTGSSEDGLVAPANDAGDGQSKVGRRYQSVETLVGSTMADDPTGLRYFESREPRKRSLFESSSPFCNWRLHVHPELTGVDLQAVSGCSLVLVLRGQHSTALADSRIAAVRQSEADRRPQRVLSFRLSDVSPESLESLREGREASFELLPRMTLGETVVQVVEDHEVQLELASIAVIVALADRPDTAAAGLELTLGVPTEPDGEPAVATVRTDAQGGARSSSSAALAGLLGPGKLPVGTFTLRFTVNGDRLSNGVAAPSDLRDIGLLLGYSYARGRLSWA